MLSAIAARKAAQAAKFAAASQPTPSTLDTVLASEHESESDSERLKSVLQKTKRKSEAVNSEKADSRKKRRKKISRSEPIQTRYYDTAEASPQAVEQDEDPSSSSSDSDGSTHHFADTVLHETVELKQPRRVKAQRAWSPSRLPGSASDDEVDFSTPGFPSASTPRTQAESLRAQKYQTAQSLSFVPHPGRNVFYFEENDIQSALGRKGTVIALVEGETTALVGVYSLTVLRGGVSLMGTELHASTPRSHIVFAPKCSPVPIIKAISSSRASQCPLPNRITQAVGPGDTVLFLEGVYTGIEGIGRICKTFEHIFEITSLGEDTLHLSGAKLLTAIPRMLQTFQVPDSWASALASLPPALSENGEVNLEPLTLLVKGQKRTGKSTFARTLINRLLCQYRRVAYLEGDIGQAEFTPPGLVSLHVIDRPTFGPPFTHPLLPYSSHFIGASSPKDSPTYYLASVSALVQTYKLELQYPAPEDDIFNSDSEDDRVGDVIPLVINTMGWLKGLGADLARQIEELSEPTHIYTIRSEGSLMDIDLPKEATPFSSTGHWGTRSAKPRTLELEVIPPRAQSTRYTAVDWRNLSLMSYFHSIPSPAQYVLLPLRTRLPDASPYDPRAPLCAWNCQLPLVAQAPYSVSPSEAIDNIVLVGAGMEDVVPSEIARVLNGAVVGLISCEAESSVFPTPSSRISLPYTQGSAPPDPSTSSCVGLALIRGISPSLLAPEEQPNAESGILHVLSPVPPALIAATSTRCFVKGEIELPIWGMLDYRELEHGAREINAVPYLQWNKNDAIGSERRKVRRNIMRKGQM